MKNVNKINKIQMQLQDNQIEGSAVKFCGANVYNSLTLHI